MNCQRCGLPMFVNSAGYAGLQCKCWAAYHPAPNAAAPAVPKDGCQPLRQLTEADVRRIVLEMQLQQQTEIDRLRTHIREMRKLLAEVAVYLAEKPLSEVWRQRCAQQALSLLRLSEDAAASPLKESP